MQDLLSKVSIVIVTYKGDELLKNCLDSIYKACKSIPEIIVVDNSPSSATKSIVQSHPNTIYIRSDGNPGFAGGNNKAIPYCNRQYILFLNNDTLIHTSESITSLVDFMDMNSSCAAAQGTGLLPQCNNTLGGCGSYLTPIGIIKTLGFLTADNPLENKTRKCFCVSGFFMMLRRQVLNDIGSRPFRTHFWCYYEEVDLCHRLWNAGHEVWYVQTPPIDHLLSITAKTFKRSLIMKRYLRNIAFSHSVNFSLIGRMRILPIFFAALFLHTLFSISLGRFSDAKNDLYAICTPWRERKRVLAARRKESRLRKLPDKILFKIILRNFSLKDLLSKIS